MSLLINSSHITNKKPFWLSKVIAGQGIAVQDGDTEPLISNTGVLTASAGTGISNVGTAQDPIFENAGIIGITPGTGISVSPGQDATITNDGILTLTAGDGMNISSGQDPIITNDGIRSISNGTGISIGGAQHDPIISNPDFYKRQFFYTQNIINRATTGGAEIVLYTENITLEPNATYMHTFSYNNYPISALPGVSVFAVFSRFLFGGLTYPAVVGNLFIQNATDIWSRGTVGTFTTANPTQYTFQLRVSVGAGQAGLLNLINVQTKLFRVS